MVNLLVIFIIILILIFYYLLLEEPKQSKIPEKVIIKKETELEKEKNISISSKKGNSLILEDGELYVTDKKFSPHKFKLLKIGNKKYCLQSLTTNLLLSVKYSVIFNNTYQVTVDNPTTEDFSTQLKIKTYKNKYFYVKFFNDYYLSVSSNGKLFATKDKLNLFYFKIKPE